jgi:hypothetical protein
MQNPIFHFFFSFCVLSDGYYFCLKIQLQNYIKIFNNSCLVVGVPLRCTAVAPNVVAAWRRRGCGSPESLCGFSTFAPVRTAVKPPPSPSRPHVVRQQWTAQCEHENKKREKSTKK